MAQDVEDAFLRQLLDGTLSDGGGSRTGRRAVRGALVAERMPWERLWIRLSLSARRISSSTADATMTWRRVQPLTLHTPCRA